MPKLESEFHLVKVTDSDESEYDDTLTSISGEYLT